MKRGAVCVALALLLGACTSSGSGPTAPSSTVVSTDDISSVLLTSSQLRRVPGLSTAEVRPLASPAPFDEPDPRGPCGAVVPRLDVSDAAGAAWKSDAFTSGGQLVVRRPAEQLQSYLAARIRDARADCAVFIVKTRIGETQQVKFQEAIGVTRDADQSLATVAAIRTNGAVRALTTIEVRTNDVLSRAVIVTERPLAAPTVRGVASLMANSLRSVS